MLVIGRAEIGIVVDNEPDILTLNYPRIFDLSGDNQPQEEPFKGKSESVRNKTKVSILVVDDDSIFARNFTAILRDHGYVAESVGSGRDAIEQFGAVDFDIVFLDIKLSDISGLEVLKKIKEIRPYTNVIMITAFPQNNLLNEAIQHGAFDCFCKPFDIDAILNIIENLGKKNGQA